MKRIIIGLGLLASLLAFGADVKISQLPLGDAATSHSGDSFPYVDSSISVTKRLKLSDLVNLPTMRSTFITSDSGWSTVGNTGLTDSTNFIGTVDSRGMIFKTHNMVRLTLSSTGDIITNLGTGVAHSSSNGTLSSSLIVNADVSSSAAIARSKLASGTADHVLINSGAGAMSSEAQLSTSRGGTGGDSSAQTGIAHVSSGTWSYSPVALGGSDVSGTLGVSNGGTGQSSLTSHSVILGNGTSGVTQLSVGGSGTLLQGVASSDPTFTATPTLGVAGATLGTLAMAGNTSGTVTIKPQAAAGTYNFNLPISAGSSGQPLLSGGGTTNAMTFGTLGANYGGTGIDSSASTGIAHIASGTWTASAVALGGSDVSGTLLVGNGGTGATTLTSHGVLIGSGSSALAATAAGTSGQILQSGGASADPAYSTATYPATTTANQLLYSSATNTLAGLATANDGALITSGAGVPSISSTLPNAVQDNITRTGTIASGTWSGTTIALNKGGTGQTTKAAAFDALSPMSASGDIIYGGASGTGTRLPKGSDSQVLTLASGIPSWANPSSGNLSIYSTLVYTGAASNTWTVTNTAFADYGADSNANAATVSGSCAAPGTKVPEIDCASMPDGTYIVIAQFTGGGQSASAQIAWRLTDGTTVFQTKASGLDSGANERYPITMIGVVVSTGTATHNFKIQGTADTGQNRIVNSTNGTIPQTAAELRFTIIRLL